MVVVVILILILLLLLLLSAGFYAENLLLLHNKQAQGSGKLPQPAGDTHSFAPVALDDVALLAAHILTGEGPHGFNDQHRGQLMVLTGQSACLSAGI